MAIRKPGIPCCCLHDMLWWGFLGTAVESVGCEAELGAVPTERGVGERKAQRAGAVLRTRGDPMACWALCYLPCRRLHAESSVTERMLRGTCLLPTALQRSRGPGKPCCFGSALLINLQKVFISVMLG